MTVDSGKYRNTNSEHIPFLSNTKDKTMFFSAFLVPLEAQVHELIFFASSALIPREFRCLSDLVPRSLLHVVKQILHAGP